MATSYYLVDPRYMTPAEIEQAYRFDQNALICDKRLDGRDPKGNQQFVYRLEAPNIIFFNLPPDVRIVNNNNDTEVQTIGDLIAQIRKTKGRITTIDEAAKIDEESHRQWLQSHLKMEGWKSFLSPCDFVPISTAMQYLSRVYNRGRQR
ncbi:hypothetical protein HYX00_00765 [Candidatus Woesearchaeota archaeon]|nr:hypothetical protein [Candidatus Woesearchaeota archaeon]